MKNSNYENNLIEKFGLTRLFIVNFILGGFSVFNLLKIINSTSTIIPDTIYNYIGVFAPLFLTFKIASSCISELENKKSNIVLKKFNVKYYILSFIFILSIFISVAFYAGFK